MQEPDEIREEEMRFRCVAAAAIGRREIRVRRFALFSSSRSAPALFEGCICGRNYSLLVFKGKVGFEAVQATSPVRWPNQAPEPTTMAVTPRAASGISK